MELLRDLTFENIAGIALVVIGVWATLKVAKTLMKLAMMAVALIGMYLFLTG